MIKLTYFIVYKFHKIMLYYFRMDRGCVCEEYLANPSITPVTQLINWKKQTIIISALINPIIY